jgi:hypothetical protein
MVDITHVSEGKETIPNSSRAHVNESGGVDRLL